MACLHDRELRPPHPFVRGRSTSRLSPYSNATSAPRTCSRLSMPTIEFHEPGAGRAVLPGPRFETRPREPEAQLVILEEVAPQPQGVLVGRAQDALGGDRVPRQVRDVLEVGRIVFAASVRHDERAVHPSESPRFDPQALRVAAAVDPRDQVGVRVEPVLPREDVAVEAALAELPPEAQVRFAVVELRLRVVVVGGVVSWPRTSRTSRRRSWAARTAGSRCCRTRRRSWSRTARDRGGRSSAGPSSAGSRLRAWWRPRHRGGRPAQRERQQDEHRSQRGTRAHGRPPWPRGSRSGRGTTLRGRGSSPPPRPRGSPCGRRRSRR